MFRAFFFILLVAGMALLFAWFADNPGQLTIDWPGYQIDITLFRFTVAIIILSAIVFLLINILARIFGSPKRLRRLMKKRRQAKGMEALRRGIFAVGSGDESTAARSSVEARRALRNEPLTMLLDAQSAQLTGDHRAAQRLFEAMVDDPETRLLGLRGLFLEASREKQMVAAEQYAARAMQLNPSLKWPVHALFDIQCRARNWSGALETLSIARTHRHIDRQTHDHRKAILLTGQAQDLEDSEASRALDLALEAHRIEPNLVPAAVIAGRILSSQGNTSKAARVLAKTWQYNPHPELAIGYAYARPGDAPKDRLERIKSLIVLNPDEPEARVALASAAVDAQNWEEAREALEPMLAKGATARVCALMARIEGGENRDAGLVREWLARAVRAPRDAVWMADGVIFSAWQPISPVTGALDAFKWRVPPDQSEKSEKDTLLDEFASLSHDMENVTLQIGDNVGKIDPSEPLTITVEPVGNEDSSAPDEIEEPKPEKKPESVAPKEETETVGEEQVKLTPWIPPQGPVAPVARNSPSTGMSAPAPASAPAEKVEPEQVVKDAPTEEIKAAEAVEVLPPPPIAPPSKQASEPDAAATPAPPKTSKKPERKEPKIFVPSRAPDDPGPDQVDFDENSTPYSRFRQTIKTQTN